MKTIDLTRRSRSLKDVLALAKSEPVLIHSDTGDDFVLEHAGDFDREVAALGASKKLDSFLKARSSQTGDVPLGEVRKKRGV